MKRLNYPILIFAATVVFNISLIAQSYKIVGTNQTDFYSDNALISVPLEGQAFFGQDANYPDNEPSYTDNGDGTITDNVTGLMWQKDMGIKISYSDAFAKADTLSLAGYNDWRVPSIKELYSLILFSGSVNGEVPFDPFIDTNYFNQPQGDTTIGERLIDAQTWSSTQYLSTTMAGDSTVFGVNFLDGRIKGYPKYQPGSGNTVPMTMYFRMVRGNSAYGNNKFVNNGDGTISDTATGLMWQQADDGQSRDWQTALSYAENLSLAGYSDWRLPNIKELQSIVDYSRCPDITSSPAINPLFSTTEIQDPDGNWGQYPYFWSSTTHLDGNNPYSPAAYIAFGEAQGKMSTTLMDVHGAGAQRSDPKSGNIADYPEFFGPQGDVRYVYNYVRCVRNIDQTSAAKNLSDDLINIYPNPIKSNLNIELSEISSSIEVEVLNILGNSILYKTYNTTKNIKIDLGTLNSGYYIVLIKTNSGIYSKKIIKN